MMVHEVQLLRLKSVISAPHWFVFMTLVIWIIRGLFEWKHYLNIIYMENAGQRSSQMASLLILIKTKVNWILHFTFLLPLFREGCYSETVSVNRLLFGQKYPSLSKTLLGQQLSRDVLVSELHSMV